MALLSLNPLGYAVDKQIKNIPKLLLSIIILIIIIKRLYILQKADDSVIFDLNRDTIFFFFFEYEGENVHS